MDAVLELIENAPRLHLKKKKKKAPSPRLLLAFNIHDGLSVVDSPDL